MLAFLLKRLAMLIVTLLLSSFAIYGALFLAPGNPITILTGGRQLPPETVAALEERYHLNEPFLAGYWQWLTNVLHGDFGNAVVSRSPVADLIGPRAATTAELVLYAGLIVVLVGIGLGVFSALRPGVLDDSVLVLTTILAAVPSFVAASFLVSVFAVNLGWFPALGDGTDFLDQLWHLTLPAIALAVPSLALVARVTRASVLEEVDREHVQTAVVRGIPRGLIIRRHILRNAAIPITAVTGVTIATLIAAVAVVEQAFSLDGLGSLLVTSAASKDFAVVQAISLILVAAFIVMSALVDLVYALVDPRVKLGSRAQ